MSRGTGLEHGGKQGIAQPATHSQPSQRRRLLCKQLFTTGFVARVPPPVVLTQPNAANNCGASAAPPPRCPPGGRWPGAVEEHPWGHTLPALLPTEPGSWLEGDGSRVLLDALQPQQSEQRFFPPQIFPAQGLEWAGLLTGAMWGHRSLGCGMGPIPTAAGLGRGTCPCTISLGCSNPQYFGTEARGLQAVYQPEQEYPRVAMATWASPWEPEGRQSCKHPAGHKQAVPSPRPPAAATDGLCHRGNLRPGVQRHCVSHPGAPLPRAHLAHAPQGKSFSPGRLRASPKVRDGADMPP